MFLKLTRVLVKFPDKGTSRHISMVCIGYITYPCNYVTSDSLDLQRGYQQTL